MSRVEWPRDRTTRLARRALAAIAVLLPIDRRGDWTAEWEAELWWLRSERGGRGRRGTLGIGTFLAAALAQVAWDRKEDWTMDSIAQDVRQALVTLARSPGFTAAAVLLLALGIGANTAIFSLLEQAVLARPPYPQVERLAVVDFLFQGPGEAEPMPGSWSYPKLAALEASVDRLDGLAGYTSRQMTLTGEGTPELVEVEWVSPSYFGLLGVRPLHGRLFGASESLEEDPRAVLLSHGFWQRRFGGDPAVVGEVLGLDGTRMRIVGVLPEGFAGLGGEAQLWMPLAAVAEVQGPDRLENPWDHFFDVLGRLAPGAGWESAGAEVAAFGSTLGERFPGPELGQGAQLTPLLEARVNPTTRTSVLALSAAVLLVLLIAAANVAGLLLARGARRQREVAVRASLGAGRLRLVRQLLAESLLLALAGGGLGVAFAWVGIGVLGTWVTQAVGRHGTRGLLYLDAGALALDGRALAVAVALVAGSVLLFGLYPAWRLSRPNLVRALKGGAGTVGRDGAALAGRHVLVVVQVALALVLLAGAGLMLRSLARIHGLDLGFAPERLLTAAYTVPGGREEPEKVLAFHRGVLERVRALPGVEGATLGQVPMGGPSFETLVLGVEGRPEIIGRELEIRVQPVPEGHFEVLGTRLLAGRGIRASDRGKTPKVMVINRTAARRLFGEGEAIGRRVQVGWGGYHERGAEVVGVVEDVRFLPPGEPPELQAYLALGQVQRASTGLLVRTHGDPQALVPLLRDTVAELDPDLALASVMSMRERAAERTARSRVVFLLLGLFAAAAVLLAAVGLYGVIAFGVARRTRELGLRAALGADRPSLLALVFQQGLALTGVGILLGLAGSWYATRYLEALLFEVPATDLPTLLAVALLLLAVTLAAVWVPARRATRVDPVEALRVE